MLSEMQRRVREQRDHRRDLLGPDSVVNGVVTIREDGMDSRINKGNYV